MPAAQQVIVRADGTVTAHANRPLAQHTLFGLRAHTPGALCARCCGGSAIASRYTKTAVRWRWPMNQRAGRTYRWMNDLCVTRKVQL